MRLVSESNSVLEALGKIVIQNHIRMASEFVSELDQNRIHIGSEMSLNNIRIVTESSWKCIKFWRTIWESCLCLIRIIRMIRVAWKSPLSRIRIELEMYQNLVRIIKESHQKHLNIVSGSDLNVKCIALESDQNRIRIQIVWESY